jgi:hypothetical protein
MRSAYGLVALSAALLGSAGQASAGNAPGGVGCEIRTAETSGGVLLLQAMALADAGAAGEYELEVRKSGGGGTSSTSQSGDFEVLGSGETLLSEVTIGGGGSLSAKLTLWSNAGEIVCTAEFPDEL